MEAHILPASPSRPRPVDLREYMTVKEAAKHLGYVREDGYVQIEKVFRLAYNRKVESAKIGWTRLVKRADIERVKREQKKKLI